MLTNQQDGTKRSYGAISSRDLEGILADPNKHTKGWHRADASQDVHKKAQNAVKEMIRKRNKSANNPDWRKSENEEKSAKLRERYQNDEDYRKHKTEENSAYKRERYQNDEDYHKHVKDSKSAYVKNKSKNDTNWYKSELNKNAERKRKKYKDNPDWRKSEIDRHAEYRQNKREKVYLQNVEENTVTLSYSDESGDVVAGSSTGAVERRMDMQRRGINEQRDEIQAMAWQRAQEGEQLEQERESQQILEDFIDWDDGHKEG